jgi:glycosyltransferase involved in cell wall biosynthesis
MRLLFVAHRSRPAIGGAEAYLQTLTRELARRHSVRVLTLGIDDGPTSRLRDSLARPPRFESFDDGAVRVEQLRLPRAPLLPLGLQVAPVARRFAYTQARLAYARVHTRAVAPIIARAAADADVVQMWGPGLLASSTVAGAQRASVPVAVMASLHPGTWGDDLASIAAYRAADAVVAQLESEASAYRALGVAPERIVTCGACSPPVGPAAHDMRTRHGITGPLVLFLGARRPYKGADLLAAAAPLVVEHHPQARFAFVGPGAALPRRRELIDAGAVDDGERADWLRAADVVCLPSAAESFGLVVTEAWSVRKPVVVSDTPALRELAARGGALVAAREPRALAAALVRLLGDGPLRARLADAGHAAWLAEFTPERVALRFESLYASLVRGAERRAA